MYIFICNYDCYLCNPLWHWVPDLTPCSQAPGLAAPTTCAESRREAMPSDENCDGNRSGSGVLAGAGWCWLVLAGAGWWLVLAGAGWWLVKPTKTPKNLGN